MKIGLSPEFACGGRARFGEVFAPLMRSSSILILCIASLSLGTGCSTSDAIEIRKAKESVERLVYDRGNRPLERVAEHPSVEANTHWEFEFVPEIAIQRTKLEKSQNEFTSVVCVKKVKIELRLPIQVWLPESASPRVIAHEDGHVAICRHFYERAERQAYLASQAILECKFSGRGETESESMQKALDAASSALVIPFRNSVVEPANRASAIYDDLTKHGQASIPAEAAVRRAIAGAE